MSRRGRGWGADQAWAAPSRSLQGLGGRGGVPGTCARVSVVDSELVRMPRSKRGERPRSLTIGRDDQEWEVIASVLVAGGILEPMALEDIEEAEGEKVLNGMS
jgi:hypothetical protein